MRAKSFFYRSSNILLWGGSNLDFFVFSGSQFFLQRVQFFLAGGSIFLQYKNYFLWRGTNIFLWEDSNLFFGIHLFFFGPIFFYREGLKKCFLKG